MSDGASLQEIGVISRQRILDNGAVGVVAGNGPFPIHFVKRAKDAGVRVVVVAHRHETDPAIEKIADRVVWIRVGELGKILKTFISEKIHYVAMAGGINRIRLFGGVKLDGRGAKLLLRLRSTKDDVIMRGIADEMLRDKIEVIPCTAFLNEWIVEEGVLTNAAPTETERSDIFVGIAAIQAMSEQHIGQLVVVREGVIVAVEAVEGSDRAIVRGGELGGAGTVVVKCAKPAQDMRFDVPTAGERTIESMTTAKARVLALEAGRCVLIDPVETIRRANAAGIVIFGIPRV